MPFVETVAFASMWSQNVYSLVELAEHFDNQTAIDAWTARVFPTFPQVDLIVRSKTSPC